MAFDFDLFVIGAGSGGVRAARIAGGHGARVAIAERRFLGGTCVNVGCVPKKLMTFAASYAHHIEDARGYGWQVSEPSHDWARFIAKKDKEIAYLNGVYQRLLDNAGVELFWGDARLVGPHTVAIGDRTVTAERILVATGGRPVVPAIPGAAEHGMISDDVFYLDEMPKRLLVVGAGYIAVEFAGVFRGLGAEVWLAHRRQRLLNEGFDEDSSRVLEQEMRKQGVEFRFECVVERIAEVDGGIRVAFSNGEAIEVDRVLFATGRVPNIEGLGLAEQGVALDASGAVRVDAENRTNVPSIYALGDVTDRLQLTPVATAEGHAFADRHFAKGQRLVDYANVPTAVFSSPPLAQVGLTEGQARAQYGDDIDIYFSDFRAMRLAFTGRDERSMMKLVVQRSTDRVLGVHMLGQDAPEIVQGFAVAVRMGATKADFDTTIGIHPTVAEEFVTLRTKREPPRAQAAAS